MRYPIRNPSDALLWEWVCWLIVARYNALFYTGNINASVYEAFKGIWDGSCNKMVALSVLPECRVFAIEDFRKVVGS